MNLSELILTRVSHDLSGIAGALYNTAELLELDPSFAEEAGPLLKTSTGFLLARLRLFRVLFGIDTATVETALATNYLKTLSAPLTLTGDVTNRIALGAVLIVAEMLIRGGTIHVEKNKVVGTGTIAADENVIAVLLGKTQEITPRSAPAAWILSLVQEKNKHMACENTDQKFTISWS